MKIKLWLAGLGIVACFAAQAQEFEAASIKPSAPPEAGKFRIAMIGGPGSPDPGRINFEFVNLRMILTKAYGVKTYQISGPAWLDSERFDIAATVPKGATKEQFAVMLQNLLADRFKITLHREMKDLPAFVMTVAKGGVKMKPAPDDPAANDAPYKLPGFGSGRIMMRMMPGRMKLSSDTMGMSQLADTLEQQLDRAVVDMTGLKGSYRVALEFEPDPGAKTMVMLGSVGSGGPPGGDGGPHNADAEPAANIFTAVQEQLGLKLEPKKAPVEMLVIDHMEKTPGGN